MTGASLLPVFSAGRQVNSGADGTYNEILDTYLRGTTYQWGAELARNGLQALERTIQAGGTPRGDEQICIDFVGLQFVDANGNPLSDPVYKRRVWNTCQPMDPTAELLEYFQSLHKGAGTNRRTRTNMSGQYGKGSRASVLGHSDMMVCTTQVGGGTHGLFIHDTGGHFTLTNFVIDRGGAKSKEDLADFSEDCYLDLGHDRLLWMEEADLIHPEVIAKGGVSTILLGQDIFAHYIEGDQSRGPKENQRGLMTALTNWLNYPIPVVIDEIRAPKGGSRPGRQVIIDGKRQEIATTVLKNYADWIARVPAGNQTCVNLTNPDGTTTTTCDVYLLPEDWNWNGPLTPAEVSTLKHDRKTPPTFIERDGKVFEVVADKDQWLPGRGEGFLVYAYDSEMIPMYGPRTIHVAACKDWGIVEQSVARRLGMVIRPPQLVSQTGPWGVQQGVSRASLIGVTEQDALPIIEWSNEFYNLLQTSPDLDFLRKALEEATPAPSRIFDPKELERIQQDIEGRLDAAAAIMWVTTKRGGVEAEDTGEPADVSGGDGPDLPPHPPGPKRPRRKRNIADPDSTNKDARAKKHKVPSYPDRVWLTEAEWEEKEKSDPAYAPDIFCVVERGTSTTLYFNMGYYTYVTQREYYSSATGWWKAEGVTKLKKVKLADLEQAVQDSYFAEGLAKVFWAQYLATDRKTKVFDRHQFMTICAPAQMTFALGGLFNVDPHIVKRIKALLK